MASMSDLYLGLVLSLSRIMLARWTFIECYLWTGIMRFPLIFSTGSVEEMAHVCCVLSMNCNWKCFITCWCFIVNSMERLYRGAPREFSCVDMLRILPRCQKKKKRKQHRKGLPFLDFAFFENEGSVILYILCSIPYINIRHKPAITKLTTRKKT
jgi:hypothetical protein